ncbi:PD-(D/E)XK nuclease family protein [Proteobacteria bacterium 005FR1]|nr:PD-(D/E)XK nuclease family protein [Proteobacteria bacterium 005FR1]
MTDTLEEWSGFFSAYETLDRERKLDKARGRNDYNLLTSVLSANDEVRLHTRFLCSLLDPEGAHYQGSKFLALFLDCLGSKNWLDPAETRVRKEYCPAGKEDQLDLYLSDGARQIVIENKLNAIDQPRQVARYLEAIECDRVGDYRDTLFVYLSKGRSRPSKRGMGELELSEIDGHQVLVKGGKPLALYQNMSYRQRGQVPSIHSWLSLCEESVAAVPNLVFILHEYRGAVERATREYRSQVKSLNQFLKKDRQNGSEYHEFAKQIMKELPRVHAAWLDEAIETMDEIFSKALESGMLTRMAKEDAHLLQPFVSKLHKQNEAKLIYQRKFDRLPPKPSRRMKGCFYLVEQGKFAGQVLIFIFYAKDRIHVGFALANPSLLGSDEAVEISKRLTPPGGLSRHFPNCFTVSDCSEDLDSSWSDFSASPYRKILDKILRYFSPAERPG